MKFSSGSLNRLIRFNLNKGEIKFSVEDLNNLESIIIDPTYDNEYSEIGLEAFGYFRNVKELTIKNMPLSNDVLEFIIKNFNNLTSLTLVNSSVFDISRLSIKKLHKLSLNNTYINNPIALGTFITLNTLELIDMKTLDLSFLNQLKNLSYLNLSNTTIEQSSIFSYINTLRSLNIYNSNIKNINSVEDLKFLQILFIDHDKVLQNKEIIRNLLNKKVLILEDGLYPLGEIYE